MEDIKIEVTDREKNTSIIEAPVDCGFNLMEVLRASEFSVAGTCGGMALCASCHVYVESDHDLKEASDAEEDMLDQAFFVEDNSRLSCQLPITKDLDGLKISLAPVGE